jgi:hypothetical protein
MDDRSFLTLPEELLLACVRPRSGRFGLTGWGHTASWSCSRDNRPSRLLAWTAGFRLTRDYVHYATGAPLGVAHPMR